MPVLSRIKGIFHRGPKVPKGKIRLERLGWTASGRKKWENLIELPTDNENAKKLILTPKSYELLTDWPSLGDGYYRLRLITPDERRTIWTVYVEIDEDGEPTFEEDPRIPKRPPEQEAEEVERQLNASQGQGMLFSPEALQQMQQVMLMMAQTFQMADQMKKQFAEMLGIPMAGPKDSKQALMEALKEMQEWEQIKKQFKGSDDATLEKLLDKMPWWAAFLTFGLQNMMPMLMMMGMRGGMMPGFGGFGMPMGGYGGMPMGAPQPQYQPAPSPNQGNAQAPGSGTFHRPAPPKPKPKPANGEPEVVVKAPPVPKPKEEPAPVQPPEKPAFKAPSPPKPKRRRREDVEKKSYVPEEYQVDPEEFSQLLKDVEKEAEDVPSIEEEWATVPEELEKDLNTTVETSIAQAQVEDVEVE